MRSLSVLLLIATAASAEEKPREPAITPEDRAHWSYVKPVRSTKHSQIDGFLREKLLEKKLDFSPEADKPTLLRRVSFDLTGLPPTVAEIDAFVNDAAANAYEKVVDRLLASPHFGERWAQHWLDAVRFAESNGYELDADRPNAWRYRDYVVKSFNDDKPYKTFLREQIAGDELAAGKDPRTVSELLVATGMHRCGPSHMVSGNLDKEMIRQEYLTEMVNGVGSAVLGLTLGCARCHNHKTDPISTADYYRVQAFFAAAQYKDVNLATKEEKEAFDKATAEIAKRLAPIKKQIEAIDAPVRAKVTAAKRAALEPKYREALDVDPKKRTPEQQKLVKDIQPVIKVSWDDVLNAMPPAEKAKRDALREQLFAIEADAPQPPAAAWSIADAAKRPTTFVRPRGDWARQGAAVTMNVPRVLAPEKYEPKSRIEFADWLTSHDQPLTARVIVNRLWHHYFGHGIVRTVADFGLTGEKPSHPELLDWLAVDLMQNDWKLKRIHKMIVMSNAYRQSSTSHSALRAPHSQDPDNRLLGKQNRKRLDAEAIRDAMLAASGELNRAVGGPGVRVPLEPEVYDLIFTEGEPDGLWIVTKDPKQHVRRSIYLFAKRNVRLPLFEAFDQPDTLTPCVGRNTSTFSPQALILMNGPFARDRSVALATALVAESKDEAARLMSLYRRAVGRAPTAEEAKAMREFLAAGSADAKTALADVCRAVLNSNEFVYVK